MEIEIVTTKKKLTKSMINQMPKSTLIDLQHGLVLGYVSNMIKTEQDTILIKRDYLYTTISKAWKLDMDRLAVFRKFGRRTNVKRFERIEERDGWWKAYQRVLEEATEQIYV